MNNITKNRDQYEFIQQDFIDISKSYLFIDSLNQLKLSTNEKVCFLVTTQSRTSMFYYFALSNSSNNLNMKNLLIRIDNEECLFEPNDFRFLVMPLSDDFISNKYKYLIANPNTLILQDGNYAIYRLMP
jgi:hypothetical protein